MAFVKPQHGYVNRLIALGVTRQCCRGHSGLVSKENDEVKPFAECNAPADLTNKLRQSNELPRKLFRPINNCL